MNCKDAFIERFHIKPYQKGILSGLTFGVKDIIDISGFITGCGNPSWKAVQKPAMANAVCVDQLLSQGASCVGKTHTDEFAFSLLGENPFYGTPLNPKAPDRVPGGSSSGSASAVACELVDFALGTDTGGSVRVPAANCGIWGFRPSHGRISVAGVHPFAPTFDTVGIFSQTFDVLEKTMSVLLASQQKNKNKDISLCVLDDAFDLCDAEIKEPVMDLLEKNDKIEHIAFSMIFQRSNKIDFERLFHIYCTIQWAEIWNTHGYIISHQKPKLGPHATKNFQITRDLDRSAIQDALYTRQWFCQTLNRFLGESRVLCIPTTPSVAPLKGSVGKDRRKGDYYPRTLGLTALSGLAQLPQLAIPIKDSDQYPHGFSLLMANGYDETLLRVGRDF